MKRLAVIFLFVAMLTADAFAQVDSTRLKELDLRLERYFAAFESEPAGVKAEECDALIAATSDSVLRQRIALRIYDHYFNSPLMGDEAVAIHLTDKWFSTGLISMGSDSDLMAARMFANFNRQSLLGMRAPEITLSDPLGELVTFPVTLSGANGLSPRYRILYFYDTDCTKCKLESAMLRSLLDDKDYPVDVYAIYVGREENSWSRWRENTFVLKDGAARVYHLWDPDDTSDYQLKYGVTSTPRMFLVDPEGVIVGRGLDSGALATMLDSFLGRKVYEYGSQESTVLFDNIFSLYDPPVSASDVSDVASLVESRTIGRGDTLAYKHLGGDLLYYLASKRTEGFREGTLSFLEDKVFPRKELWETPSDSLQVLGMAGMLHSLLSKAPVGSRIPRMPLKGWNRFRRKGGYLLFHTEGCPSCAEQLAIADSLGLKYFHVNMDEVGEYDPASARKLLDAFDLSSLPYVLETGRKGVVKRRYLNLSDGLLFLNEKK